MQINPSEVLYKAIHRMDGVNYSFKVESNKNGKSDKTKYFRVSVFWPEDNEINRMTRVESLNPKRKKPSSFWEHRYFENNKKRGSFSLRSL